MSSLETLLEAAKFVENTNTSQVGARVPDPPEFHHYAKSPPALRRSNSGSDKSDQNDDARDRKRYGGGTREVHNKLEKNRRAHLKECFDSLKQQVPNLENHNKVSNLSILRGAFRYIQLLGRKEKALEQERQLLAQVKISLQSRVAKLKSDLDQLDVEIDVSHFLPPCDEDTRSDTTATAHNGSPIMSEDEDEDMPTSASSQALSFHNVLISPSNQAPQAPAVSASPSVIVERVETHSQPIASPIFTIKRMVSPNKVEFLGSGTIGSNRTIAAMLTNAQSLLPDYTAKKIGSIHNNNLIPTKLIQQGKSGISLIQSSSLASSVANHSTALSTRTPGVATNIINQSALQTSSNKIPVTQILQQTIAQRVQLQQLAKLAQQQQQQSQQQAITAVVMGSSAPSNSTATVSVTLPQVYTVNTSGLRPAISGMKAGVSHIRPAISLNHVVPVTISSANSLQAGSIATINTTAATTPSVVATHPAIISQLTGLTGLNTTTPNIGGLPTLNLATVKPILTLPFAQIQAAQLMSPQVSTLQQLMNQVTGKSTHLQTVAPAAATTSTMSLLSPMVTAASGLTPITGTTQFVPITMISQAGGHAAQGLNTVTLTTPTLGGTGTPVLKTLGHLPFLQQPFSLPMKPIVMVSVPGTVSTTVASATVTTPTIQVNLPPS